jgi:hypothetical protein
MILKKRLFTLTNTKTSDKVKTTQPEYNEKTNIAKFALAVDQALKPSTKYEFTIKSTLRNTVGIPMKKDENWFFTTGVS